MWEVVDGIYLAQDGSKWLVLVNMLMNRGVSKKKNYEGWNFNFGNTPLDWIQELLE